MDYKKEIIKLLELLKLKGHDRATIEEKLGYAENAIDQSLARNGSMKLYKSLLLYRDWVLSNSIPAGEGNLENLVNDGEKQYGLQGRLLNMLQQSLDDNSKHADSINELSKAHLILATKLSSGGTGPASQPLGEENKVQRNPVQQTSFLDKSKIHSPKKLGKQKGIVSRKGS